MSNYINCRVIFTHRSPLGFIAINTLILIFVITPSSSLLPGPSTPNTNTGHNKVVEQVNENGKVVATTSFHLSDDPDDVKFYLYRDLTNPNKSEELLLNDTKRVNASSFNKNDKTVFVIHGFLSNSSSGMASVIKNGFFDAKLITNLILVDWGRLSTPAPNFPILLPLAYPFIVHRSIPIVYKRVGEFVQFLLDNRFTTLDKLHIIGHSLGAHVSGGVGEEITENPKNGGRQIARISGLDPAGPLFQGIQVQRRINMSDAEFVDIYHTAAGTLGTLVRDEGHANFLPNGGHHQPGCRSVVSPLFEADGGSCSHSFVNRFYAASIQKNFTACRCDPQFFDYILTNSCPGDCAVSVLAGYPCPSDARGQFYFETGEDPSAGEPEPEQGASGDKPSQNSVHDGHHKRSVPDTGDDEEDDNDDDEDEDDDKDGDETEVDIKIVNNILNIT